MRPTALWYCICACLLACTNDAPSQPAVAPTPAAPRAPAPYAYFVASPAQMEAHFRGWLKPLTEPRELRKPNPMTGEVVRILSFEPAGPWPSGLQERPDLADLSPLQLPLYAPELFADLAVALGIGKREQLIPTLDAPARYAPPDVKGRVVRVPRPLLITLGGMEPGPLAQLYESAFYGRTTAMTLKQLEQLAALAQTAVSPDVSMFAFDPNGDSTPQMLELNLPTQK